MNRIESLLNEQSGCAAVAEVAFADAGELNRFSLIGRQSIGGPSSGAVGNPPLFTAGWSNPNSSDSISMANSKGPASFELDNVEVGDGVRAQRIHNYQIGFPQHKAWSKPQEINRGCNCKTQDELKPVAGWVHDCLNQIQGGKEHSNRAPHKVAFRLESLIFTHSSIFTGISANGKGK